MPCILFNQCFGDGHAELILYFAAKSSRAVYEIPQCNGRAGPSMTDMFTYFSL